MFSFMYMVLFVSQYMLNLSCKSYRDRSHYTIATWRLIVRCKTQPDSSYLFLRLAWRGYRPFVSWPQLIRHYYTKRYNSLNTLFAIKKERFYWFLVILACFYRTDKMIWGLVIPCLIFGIGLNDCFV